MPYHPGQLMSSQAPVSSALIAGIITPSPPPPFLLPGIPELAWNRGSSFLLCRQCACDVFEQGVLFWAEGELSQPSCYC